MKGSIYGFGRSVTFKEPKTITATITQVHCPACGGEWRHYWDAHCITTEVATAFCNFNCRKNGLTEREECSHLICNTISSEQKEVPNPYYKE